MKLQREFIILSAETLISPVPDVPPDTDPNYSGPKRPGHLYHWIRALTSLVPNGVRHLLLDTGLCHPGPNYIRNHATAYRPLLTCAKITCYLMRGHICESRCTLTAYGQGLTGVFSDKGHLLTTFSTSGLHFTLFIIYLVTMEPTLTLMGSNNTTTTCVGSPWHSEQKKCAFVLLELPPGADFTLSCLTERFSLGLSTQSLR